MIDLFLNTLILIFTYIIVFAIYYALLVIMSAKKKQIDRKQKYTQHEYNNNLVVIIYAQNNEKTIIPLLEQLNNQDYPKSNYQTHIILDNCTDNSGNSLEFIGGAKIWRLSEGAPMGKDESISWLLERLISFQNVNAFIFLNANRSVESNFLSSINSALYENNIVVGSTDLILNDNSFKSVMLDKVNKYKNQIIKTGRSVLGLTTVIDSDVVAIKQEVLEKIKCVDFKDVNSELKYTLLLARNNFISIFDPNVKTKVNIDDFEIKKPQLSYKLSLLKHCSKLILSTNPKFGEFILSMFTPNILLLLLIYSGFLFFTYNYYFFFDFPIVLLVGAIFIVSFGYSIFTFKNEISIIKYLLSFPFVNFYENKIKPTILGRIFNKENIPEKFRNIEKAVVDVVVTDGKNSLPCKLELISEDGLVKVVFRFKKKKYVTDSYIRMYDAIANITKKLEIHGFRLKICQNCAYFTSKIDGSTNMIKGFCNKDNINNPELSPKEKLLWNSCNFYIPLDVNKVIDISNFRNKND